MTIQYSSDTKRAYEDFLKEYDADKSGVSDWTEYLTGLQQSVKDTSTAYQKSAYNDISQAYRNYFIQSSNLAGKGLASGLKQDLSSQLYSSYQNTKAGVEESAANKITSLLENYSKTVSEGEKKLSEQASNLTKVTEAALDWYEQVGSSKKILDDKMQETDQYRYQDLIDLYNENRGELWQKSSDDISSPYVLSGLGQAIVDTAFADEDFANYLKDYDSKLDLRDVFLDNKDALYEALNVGKLPQNINNIMKTSGDENVPWNITELTYGNAEQAKQAINDIKSVDYEGERLSMFNTVRSERAKRINNETYYYDYADKPISETDDVYTKYLKFLNPTEDGVYKIKNEYYANEDGQWFLMKNQKDFDVDRKQKYEQQEDRRKALKGGKYLRDYINKYGRAPAES